MKRIVLVINGKGGVGKSLFSVNLIQFLKDKAIPHVAFDTDNENSTLTRFHPEAIFIDPAKPRHLDLIFIALNTAPLVIVDCRAASADLFLAYFSDINLPELLPQIGVSLTLVIPINHEADSVEQVQRLAERLGSACHYLVIRNTSQSESFASYESMEFRPKILGELGGREIDMTRLQDWLVEGLSLEGVILAAALKHPSFSLLARQRSLIWRRRFNDAIDFAHRRLSAGKDASG